jgi:hypothetical protein
MRADIKNYIKKIVRYAKGISVKPYCLLAFYNFSPFLDRFGQISPWISLRVYLYPMKIVSLW